MKNGVLEDRAAQTEYWSTQLHWKPYRNIESALLGCCSCWLERIQCQRRARNTFYKNGLTSAAHGASQTSSPVRWCTVNKTLSTLTVHGWCQQPQSARASVPDSRMNAGKCFPGSVAESPVVPDCWGRRELPTQPHWEDNVLHTLQGCAASPHSRQCRLGVGARWRNATTVKTDRRVNWVSGVVFQNNCLLER